MRVAEFLNHPPEPVEAWPTGLSSLDQLIGGFRRGHVWVITGAPCSGKPLLLTQFVFMLAVHHNFATDYYCSKSDHADLTRARLLSLSVNRAPRIPDLVVPLDELPEPSQAALHALRASPLEIHSGGAFTIPHWHDARDAKRCLTVDDPEFKRPPVLDRSALKEFRASADRGAIVLVTVPRSLCIEPAVSGERLREEWSSVADIIIEIVPGQWGNDVLHMWQNRRGPLWDIPVVAQAHYGKFVNSSS